MNRKWLDGTLDRYGFKLTMTWLFIYFVIIGYVAARLLHTYYIG